jgi:thymidylate kinase
MSVAVAIDSAVDDRVLVLGSFPPQGRDLDVVARERTREMIGAALARWEFVARGRGISPSRAWVQQWVRFDGGAAFAVDVHPPERWGIRGAELEALFADGVPVEGMRHVVRCAPHHVLLLTARGLVGRGGRLDAKRRRRIARALEEDSRAWPRAAEEAPGWGLTSALAALEFAYRSDMPLGRAPRARARLELMAAGGPRGAARRAARWLSSRRPRRVRVVSLSGMDGAGKSTQSLLLQEMFGGVGADMVVSWMPLGHSHQHATLRVIRGSARRARALTRRARGAPVARAGAQETKPAHGATERSETVAQAWATTVALLQALQHRRAALRHAGSGKIVLFDRYVLDSSAQLRLFYGAGRRFRVQTWLLRVVSPTPVLSFWLDVSPRALAARKEPQYSFETVCLQWQLYQQGLAGCGVQRLDGERPQADLTDEIAEQIWRVTGR